MENNNNKKLIYPPIKKAINVNQFSIDVVSLKLFEYVQLNVVLFTPDDIPVESRLFLLQGQDYLNWSSDDKYIYDYVKAKLQNEC